MKIQRIGLAIAMLAAASVSGVLLAQAPSSGGQSQPDPQKPTFRTRIDLVTTDVIVRDGRGQFVADLKPGDFEVYEDGVLQDVVQILLFHGGRQYSPLAAPAPQQQEGIVLPPPRPTNDAAGRIFVFFVDDLHLDFRNTGRIRDLFKKIRKTLVHEGDMFCIVSTGPNSIATDLTYDLKRLDDAISRISGSALRPADILEGGSGVEGPSEVRYRAHVAFSTAFDLIQQLETVHNRRKALVYVSNGYDFNPYPEARYKAEQDRAPRSTDTGSSDPNNQNYSNAQDDPTDLFSRQGQIFAEADLARELSELTRSANRANVSFYTIDPRGLVGMPDLDETVDMTEFQNYIRKSQDSLIVLANETGGRAIVNQNDFDKALKLIDAETSDYYVLGYYSKNPDPLRRNRRIDVKVTRKDVTVFARKGYSLKSPPKVKPVTK